VSVAFRKSSAILVRYILSAMPRQLLLPWTGLLNFRLRGENSGNDAVFAQSKSSQQIAFCHSMKRSTTA
jgi:hypothetical protein